MWKGGYFAGSFGYLSPCRRYYWRLRMARRSLTIFNCSDGFVVSTAMEDRMSIGNWNRGPHCSQWYGLQDYLSVKDCTSAVDRFLSANPSQWGLEPRLEIGHGVCTYLRKWNLYIPGAQGILYRSCVFERLPVTGTYLFVRCQSMYQLLGSVWGVSYKKLNFFFFRVARFICRLA